VRCLAGADPPIGRPDIPGLNRGRQIVPNGTTVPVAIIGSGFVNGATVTISAGFTVNSVTFTDSSHLTVSVKANSGNPNKGTYDLTVTNPDGGWVTSVGSMVNQ
jgi:hypothetical protein